MVQQAAQGVGEEAQERQAILPAVQGSAAVGRIHVWLDCLLGCLYSPRETGLASWGELADELLAGWIRLGSVHLEFERNTLWVHGGAMKFRQG